MALLPAVDMTATGKRVESLNDYEYSGRIVLGIEPEQGKSGQERYQEVHELLFDKGVLIDDADITAPWNAVCEKQKGQPEDYWWEEKDNNYFDLMNYAFMGVRSALDPIAAPLQHFSEYTVHHPLT